jgi:hypothetical protein
MQRIGIERYQREIHDSPNGWDYAGLIEGTRDDGSRWIMWLDKAGSPALFWPYRDDDGAVVGDPIVLTAEAPVPAT